MEWISVDERLPEPGQWVLVGYLAPDCGESLDFDCIDECSDEKDSWYYHSNRYEEFCAVRQEGWVGPSEKAPYTHWAAISPLPQPPEEVE